MAWHNTGTLRQLTTQRGDLDGIARPGFGQLARLRSHRGRRGHQPAAYAVKNGSVSPGATTPTGRRPPPASASSGVVAVAGGDDHAVALKSDGSVVGWGYNGSGQTNVPAAASSGVVAIAAGDDYSLALKSDGSVVVWGGGSCGLRPTLPAVASSGVTALPSGRSGGGTPSPAPPALEPRRHPDLGPDRLQAARHRDPGRLLPRRQQQRHPQHPDQRSAGHRGEPRRHREGRLIDRVGLATSAPHRHLRPRHRRRPVAQAPTTAPAGLAGQPRSSAGHATSSPTVASWGSNRLDLFVRGSSNDLQHTA